MKSYSWIAALLVCAALAPLATRGTVNAEDEEEKPGAEKDRDGEGESTGKTGLGTSLSLERLVQLNAKSLFGGGKVTVKDGRVEVLLDADGHLYSAFRGKGLMDSTHERMKGANRRFIQYGTEEDKKKGSGKEKEEEKLLP
ncbi:MAG: hypothetical protein O7J95_00660, partial [Planctomycetota bacterium]|nr:hypothetical protein [Planctomycetota bacterium]